MSSAPTPDLSWILNQLMNVPHARHAVLLSADGLLLARTKDVDRDLADTAAAIMSGMQSLSRAAMAFASGKGDDVWESTMSQFRDGFLFLIAAGDGSYLAVAARRKVDVQHISYRMEKTVQACADALAQAPRHGTADLA